MEWRPTFPVPVGARALAVRHLVLLGCNGHGLQRTEDSNEALGEDASSAEASGGAFARRHMRIANTDRACKVGKDGTSQSDKSSLRCHSLIERAPRLFYFFKISPKMSPKRFKKLHWFQRSRAENCYQMTKKNCLKSKNCF